MESVSRMPRKFTLVVHKPLFVISFSAFIIALFINLKQGVETLGVDDAESYVSQAHLLLSGWSNILSNGELFSHGIGFSVIIAATFLLGNSESLILFKLILAIGHGLSTYLVARIGIYIGLRKYLWIGCSLFFALDPFILLAATRVQTESLVTLVVLYWAYLYLSPSPDKINTIWSIVVFPLSGFLLTTVRPNVILPFLAIAILVYSKWLYDKISIFLLGFSVGLFISLLTLFELLITRIYSGFVFLSPVGGASAPLMCRTDFIPQYLGLISTEENQRINKLMENATHTSDLLLKYPNYSISEINSSLTQAGVMKCLENPVQSIGVLIIKAFALWRPFTVFGAYGSWIFVASLMIWLPLTMLAIKFIFSKSLSISENKLRKFFIFLSLSFTLSLLLTQTQVRHRVAFAEPFYWIFALHAVEIYFRKPRNLRSRIRKLVDRTAISSE